MDPLDMAATGIPILGGLFSGIMGLFAGNAEAKIDKENAFQDEREGTVNSEVALQKGDATAAAAATQAAANGGGLVGSSIGVIAQDSRTAMFNARTQIYRGDTAARADLYKGQVAQANGINGLIGSVTGAVGTGITGAANAGMRQSILNSFAQNRGDQSADPFFGLL